SVGLSKNARTGLPGLIVASAVACAFFVSRIPPDETLGTLVRFVMYHGASTWVNMATFTLAGMLGMAFAAGLVRSPRWGEAFRWISLPLWGINTVLGILSMKLIWGGILWDEPRLHMTFGLLVAALLVFAVQLIAHGRPKIPAVLDAVLAAGLWFFVLVLPNMFHPDSPVFSSGNWDYIGNFLGIVGSLAIIALSIATLIAKRRDDGAE
ncbi:MAG TPA: hypothetical protein VFE45_01820, partial [Coriobacteriia bacterium]|nr:hypothetical protein [Coriobacteriia bacterium]